MTKKPKFTGRRKQRQVSDEAKQIDMETAIAESHVERHLPEYLDNAEKHMNDSQPIAEMLEEPGGMSLESHQGPFDEAVEIFILIRDEIKRREEAFEESLAGLKAKKKQVEGIIRQILESNGQESARSKHGTAYLSERTTASLSDPDAFMQFVTENKLFDLMERRAASVPVQDYARAHGHLPPGCNLSTIQIVGVRKS